MDEPTGYYPTRGERRVRLLCHAAYGVGVTGVVLGLTGLVATGVDDWAWVVVGSGALTSIGLLGLLLLIRRSYARWTGRQR